MICKKSCCWSFVSDVSLLQKKRGDDFPAFLIREVDKLKESLLASFAENFPSTLIEAPSGENDGGEDAVFENGEKGGCDNLALHKNR